MNIDHFIQKFPLEEFIKDNYNGPVVDDVTHWVLKCPNCSKQKLHILKEKKIFHCFSCETKGNLLTLICLYKNISIDQAIVLVCGNEPQKINDELAEKIFKFTNNDILPIVKTDEPNSNIVSLPGDYRPLYFYSMDSEAMVYANKRGLTAEHISMFDIGYSQKMRRLVFPIYYIDELVGWQSRTIDDNNPIKALTCPGMEKSHFLYNYDNCTNVKSLILTEGPIDCVKSFKHNSIALLGKKISKVQLNLLLTLNLKRIYLGLDPDAFKETQCLSKNLSGFIDEIRILEIDENKDLGDSSEEEINKYVENSKKCQKIDYFSFLN